MHANVSDSGNELALKLLTAPIGHLKSLLENVDFAGEQQVVDSRSPLLHIEIGNFILYNSVIYACIIVTITVANLSRVP